MRPRAPLALLASCALLAGCAGAPDATPDGAPLGVAQPHEGFFTSDMRLSPDVEDATTGVRSGSFFAAWAEGADYPTWRGEPLQVAQVVQNVTAKLFVRATGPVVESVRFPDIMIYGGSGEAWMPAATTKFASVLVPGEVHEIDLALEMPVGGLVVPVGEALGFKVVPVMHQNEAADIEILVGGEHASRVAFTSAATTLPVVPLAAGADAGEAVGSAYAGAAAPPTTSAQFVVAANATPRALLVWMNVTDHQGIPDVDLAVIAPDGTQLAFGGTPTPREFIRLMEPNLRAAGPGDYTIVVTSYGSARATFSVEWLVG